jgi:predicted nucleic acid-binding Zn ribbon protein
MTRTKGDVKLKAGEFLCVQCERPFSTYTRPNRKGRPEPAFGKRFCSNRCRVANSRGQKEYGYSTCPICQHSYKQKTINQVFCGRKCREEFHKLEKRAQAEKEKQT